MHVQAIIGPTNDHFSAKNKLSILEPDFTKSERNRRSTRGPFWTIFWKKEIILFGGLVFLWSNFPSLMVDYYVQLGNLLLLITSPILI